MRPSNLLILLWSVTLLLLPAGCGSAPEKSAEPDQSEGPAAAHIVTVYAYGIVEARHHSTLSAKFPGKIEKIFVREGERVRQGQVLAQFEARELETQVASARAAATVAQAALAEAEAGSRPQELAMAREQLTAAEAELAKARADWERYQRLLATNAVAASDWERYRLHLASSEAQRNAASEQVQLLAEGTRAETIAVLKRRLELARAEVVRAEAAFENARLTAPYDGVITRKHREEGEAMDIGLPVMDIATLDDRYVLAEIDETDVGRVRQDMEARVTADGFPGLAFNGRVIAVKQQMGPKLLIPTDPSKIIDYKVLNVEVSLPPECPFPIKLPVNVRISLEPGATGPPQPK